LDLNKVKRVINNYRGKRTRVIRTISL